MKLTTIWTIRRMRLAVRLRHTRDWGATRIAYALPRRVRYFSTLGDLGVATMDSPNVPATPLDDVLRKLPAPRTLS